jgi:hypothetical protein
MSLLFNYLASCFFTKDPMELEPTRAFVLKNMGFFLGLGFIVEGLIADPADGVLEVSLRFIMALTTISLFLLSKKRFYDFQKFVTAIFVCENFIFSLAAGVEGIYFYMIMAKYGEAKSELVAWILGGALLVWYLAIIAYVIRQFFKYSIIESLIFAFSYFVLAYGIPMMFMDM